MKEKKILFSIIIILIHIDIYLSSKELRLGVFQNNDEQFIFFRIGTPPQFFRLKLDTFSHHIWLANITASNQIQNAYNPQKSSTVEQTNEHISTRLEDGKEIKDVIYLQDEVISNTIKYSVVLLNKVDFDYNSDGVLGLAKKYPGMTRYDSREINANPRFSLIEYLYTNQMIASKIFSLRYNDNNRAVLLLGSEGNSKQRIKYCKSDPSRKDHKLYDSWNCEAKGITYENGSYIVEFDKNFKKMVVFNSNIDVISLNTKEAKKIFKAIINITNGECKEIIYEHRGKALFCMNTLDRKLIPNLYLQLEEFSLILPAKELFRNYYYTYSSTKDEFGFILKIVGVNIKDYMLIGVPFMKYYHMVFDMENERVGFGDFVDVFVDSTINQNRRFYPFFGGWRRNPWSITIYVLITILFGVILYTIYNCLKSRKIKKKVRGYKKEETLVEPIGTPMVDIN